MKALSIDLQTSAGAVLVALAGELDIATCADAEAALRGAQCGEVSVVVLDLRGLRFMDSTGLRLLLQADARARESGGRLAIVRGPPPVHRVLEITGLDGKLDLIDDPAQAGL